MIPTSFVKYLYHFHVDRDYFECHEILEEYWKEETQQDKNSIWVGLILLAVANYHHRRNNFTGAIKTIEKAIAIFQKKEDELRKLGFSVEAFEMTLKNHLLLLNDKRNYISYNLPIINKDVLNQCFLIAPEAKINWGIGSDLSNQNLIHRHTLRNRSSVIAERQNALEQRKKAMKKPNN